MIHLPAHAIGIDRKTLCGIAWRVTNEGPKLATKAELVTCAERLKASEKKEARQ